METEAIYRLAGLETVDGEPFDLSPREREILELVCKALPDKSIARRLGISPKTVGAHMEHIYLKMGVRGDFHNARCLVMLLAFEHGLFFPPAPRDNGPA